MRYIVLLILFFLSQSNTILSAQTIKTSANAIVIHIDYGYNLSGGDLKDRFGNNFTLGGALEYKMGSWFTGINYHYIFGNVVKEDVLSNLRNDKDEYVGIDGHISNILVQERGYTTTAYAGHLVKLGGSLQHFLKLSMGVGILQHKIKITDEYNVMPQIFGDYRYGYDRLVNGPMLEEYIGYQFLSSNKRINFSAGFVFRQGFTRQRRVADYPLNVDPAETTGIKRLDLLQGFKVSWIMPFYFQGNAEEIIY